MLATFACSSSSTPSDAVKSAYSAMTSGDFTTAVTYIYLGEDKTTMSKEQMDDYRGWVMKDLEKTVKRDIKNYGEVTSVEILSETIEESGDKAEVESKIVYSNGKEDTESISLVLVNGKWLIDL